MISGNLQLLLVPVLVALTAAIVGAGARTQTEATKAPGIDLRPSFAKWGLDRRRQGARGTCSVFAVTGALEYAFAREHAGGARLSVEFLNWAAHTAVGRRADGGFFSEIWNGYEQFGICPESSLPYADAFDPDLRPTAAVLNAARTSAEAGLKLHWIKEWNPGTGVTAPQLAAIKTALDQRWPVCGGFRWPKKPEWVRDVLQLCPPEDVFDGHSVLLVGYQDDSAQPGGGLFIIRNSGGDGADGFLPYAYVRNFMNDAIWIAAPLPEHPAARAGQPQIGN